MEHNYHMLYTLPKNICTLMQTLLRKYIWIPKTELKISCLLREWTGLACWTYFEINSMLDQPFKFWKARIQVLPESEALMSSIAILALLKDTIGSVTFCYWNKLSATPPNIAFDLPIFSFKVVPWVGNLVRCKIEPFYGHTKAAFISRGEIKIPTL